MYRQGIGIPSVLEVNWDLMDALTPLPIIPIYFRCLLEFCKIESRGVRGDGGLIKSATLRRFTLYRNKIKKENTKDQKS